MLLVTKVFNQIKTKFSIMQVLILPKVRNVLKGKRFETTSAITTTTEHLISHSERTLQICRNPAMDSDININA